MYTLTVPDLIVRVKEVRGLLPDTFPDLPSDELIDEVIPEVFTDRPFKGRAAVRRRSSLTKDAGSNARALAGMLNWHNSGGDLTGLFIAKMQAGDAYGQLETLGIILRRIAGQVNSPAVDAWRRTGLV